MANTQKHVFFGSMFAFNPNGVDEFLDRFKKGYEDPNLAPFLSYDAKAHLFSCSVDQEDYNTPPYLLSQLKSFTTNPPSSDAAEPPFVPLEGSRIRTLADDHLTSYDASEMLGIEIADSSSEDENDPLQGIEHLTRYWKPRNGDIGILSTTTALTIASLTGCSLYPETHEKRVRLVNGDFEAALNKLRNLEPLMELQYRQQTFNTPKANGNILVNSDNEINPRMEVEPVNNVEHPAFQRLIVDKHAAPFLTSLSLLEGRIRDGEGEDGRPNYDVHPNLVVLEGAVTDRQAGFEIWQNHIFETFGNQENMHPQTPFHQSTSQKSKVEISTSKLGANDFIGQEKAAHIVGWATGTDQLADPYTAVPEPDKEEAMTRRRRVAVDSDDSDDEAGQPSLRTKGVDKSVDEPHPKQDLDHTPVAKQTGAQLYSAAAGPNIGNEDRDDDNTTTTDTFFPKVKKSSIPPSVLSSDLLRHSDIDINNPDYDPFSVSELQHELQDITHEASTTQSHILVIPNKEAESEQQHQTVLKDNNRTVTYLDSTRSEQGNWVADRRIQSSNTAPHFSNAAVAPKASDPQPVAYPHHTTKPQPVLTGDQSITGETDWIVKQSPVLSQQSSSSSGMFSGQAVVRSHSRGSKFRGRGGFPSSTRDTSPHHSLVNPPKATPSRPIMPPPGLNIQLPESTKENLIPPRTPNLVDDTIAPTEVSISQRSKSDLISFSSASNATGNRNDSKQYVNTNPARFNSKHIKNQHLEKLYAKQAAQQKGRIQSTAGNSTSSKKATEKKVDDLQDARFHSTMSQKAGNRGKKAGRGTGGNRGGKTAQNESAADRKKRMEDALNDAYGPPLMPKASSSNVKPPEQNLADMSTKKRQLLSKNVHMANANADALRQNEQEQTLTNLMTQLQPMFEATRAFSGELSFSLQLGQILISHSGQVVSGKVYDSKGWDKLFSSAAKTAPPLASFTSHVTTNGADIDRVFEIKKHGQKAWDASQPGRESVTYEFHCQSKYGNDFWLIIDQYGSYTIRHSRKVIGMVALQVPDQVWDACAILQGTENWDEPPISILDAVSNFFGTIYLIPNRRELALVFRHPSNNEITVTHVLVKRVSRHQARAPDHSNIELQVTEVKELYNKVHPQDRKLWQVYEKSFLEMVADGLLHYELAIVDRSINDSLLQNEDLELGELTPAAITGRSLLKTDNLRQLLDLTIHTITKINWLGSSNDGTLARAHRAEEEQRMRQQQSLPPLARSRLNLVVPASRIAPRPVGGSTVSGRGVGSSITPTAPQYIPGTRAGTRAEVYADEFGNRFAKGFGGARVPVIDPTVVGGTRLSVIGETEVAPDDSASQAGNRGVGTAGWGRQTRTSTVGPHESKPPGYW